MNDIKPRIDFFRELNTQTIYEIKDDLLKHSKGSIATYNEIVNDYRAFIFRQAGIDPYITFKETEKEFLNYKVDELALLDRGDILHFKEFEIYDRKLLFDFITIEPNSIKVFQLKISCKYEEETERINVYAFGAFGFKEACKMAIALLMEQKPAEPEPMQQANTSTVEKIIFKNEQNGEMFSNNGFELFEYILAEFVKPKNTTGRFEEISYYYRCLFEDKFIHQKPEPFRLWFIGKYSEEFTKIKTKDTTTNAQRKKDYSTALDWFNAKNN